MLSHFSDTDHFAAIVTYHGAHYRLILWDSPGQDELFAPVRQILLQQVSSLLDAFENFELFLCAWLVTRLNLLYLRSR